MLPNDQCIALKFKDDPVETKPFPNLYDADR